ncbi:MAG TPA: AI-2E family transporter [Candidatus Nanoarchaeia archaeon]|nr:AI-2E family transporter [Candidatus Nanoarchaeia archaeon]
MLSTNSRPQKLILLFILLVLVTLSFLLIRPFIITIISAGVLAYLCYPVFSIINSRIRRKTFSALIIIFLLILLIAIPLYFVLNALYMETKIILQNYDYTSLINTLSPELSDFLDEGIKKMVMFIASKASEFLLSLPSLLINLLIFITCLFYFIKDGPELFLKLESLLPFRHEEKQFLHNEFKKTASGVMYSVVLTGLIEGVLGAVGFYIFGVPSPILWGLIMFILTFIPGLGTILVWGPAGIIKLIQGSTFSGIGIIIYGVLLIILVEFMLKNKIIVDKSKIHPLIVLLGVLGGLKFLGLVGLIIGPVILGMLIPFIRTFVLEHDKSKS